jgi:hypothetical protein
MHHNKTQLDKLLENCCLEGNKIQLDKGNWY